MVRQKLEISLQAVALSGVECLFIIFLASQGLVRPCKVSLFFLSFLTVTSLSSSFFVPKRISLLPSLGLLLNYIYVCVWGQGMLMPQPYVVRRQLQGIICCFLPPCWSPKLISGCQIWQQLPLPWVILFLFFKAGSHVVSAGLKPLCSWGWI